MLVLVRSLAARDLPAICLQDGNPFPWLLEAIIVGVVRLKIPLGLKRNDKSATTLDNSPQFPQGRRQIPRVLQGMRAEPPIDGFVLERKVLDESFAGLESIGPFREFQLLRVAVNDQRLDLVDHVELIGRETVIPAEISHLVIVVEPLSQELPHDDELLRSRLTPTGQMTPGAFLALLRNVLRVRLRGAE